MLDSAHSRARLTSVVAGLAARIERLAAERGQALKSINEVGREYDNQLNRIAYSGINGGADAVDLRREIKALIRSIAPQMFEEGWREGGGEVEDIEPEDAAYARDWANEQAGHVNDFAAWLVGDDKKAIRAALPGRIDAWVSSLRNLGEIASQKAKGDPRLMFDGDDGEESCDDCREYKGQVHKLSWWEKRGLTKRNGNDGFACGRWENCNHHFYDAKTKEMVIE